MLLLVDRRRSPPTHTPFASIIVDTPPSAFAPVPSGMRGCNTVDVFTAAPAAGSPLYFDNFPKPTSSSWWSWRKRFATPVGCLVLASLPASIRHALLAVGVEAEE